MGCFAALIERLFLRRLEGLDHLYGLLFTFGLAIALEGTFRDIYGSAGPSYPPPPELRGVLDLGFMRLPIYRAWVVAISLVHLHLAADRADPLRIVCAASASCRRYRLAAVTT